VISIKLQKVIIRLGKISRGICSWWRSLPQSKKLLVICSVALVVGLVAAGIVTSIKPKHSQTTSQSSEESDEGIPQPLEKFEDYGLLIEKIGVSAPIIPNVDGLNEKIYYPALKKGVAQFKGSQNPDEKGNLFVFGHSSYMPGAVGTKFTEVFKRLYELKKGNEFVVYYKGTQYHYKVTKSFKTDDKDWSVMDPTPKNQDDKTVTLMTCWPPGSNVKRWVVTATQES